jgi:hypothetical protein
MLFFINLQFKLTEMLLILAQIAGWRRKKEAGSQYFHKKLLRCGNYCIM